MKLSPHSPRGKDKLHKGVHDRELRTTNTYQTKAEKPETACALNLIYLICFLSSSQVIELGTFLRPHHVIQQTRYATFLSSFAAIQASDPLLASGSTQCVLHTLFAAIRFDCDALFDQLIVCSFNHTTTRITSQSQIGPPSIESCCSCLNEYQLAGYCVLEFLLITCAILETPLLLLAVEHNRL